MSLMVALLLVVRVFDRTGESSADRHAALRTAEAILKDASIGAVWVDCSRGSPASVRPECTSPLAAGERAVRITKGPGGTVDRDHWALGYSLVEPESRRGTLATVFSDRVAWLAGASRTRQTTLLGRAVAHEIGHLLIGTNEHTSNGLMRATWTAAELTRNHAEDWLFTAHDRSLLHDTEVSGDIPRLASSDREPHHDGTMIRDF